ncbi:MAG: hypothetical protein FWPMV1_gp1 [Hangzhou whitmania pigra medionivirus 1]|nr:MAG: hypothetical protein FWPMV1_gp1 [Hangzhou whitmania pigra medionivirus 1]
MYCQMDNSGYIVSDDAEDFDLLLNDLGGAPTPSLGSSVAIANKVLLADALFDDDDVKNDFSNAVAFSECPNDSLFSNIVTFSECPKGTVAFPECSKDSSFSNVVSFSNSLKDDFCSNLVVSSDNSFSNFSTLSKSFVNSLSSSIVSFSEVSPTLNISNTIRYDAANVLKRVNDARLTIVNRGVNYFDDYLECDCALFCASCECCIIRAAKFPDYLPAEYSVDYSSSFENSAVVVKDIFDDSIWLSNDVVCDNVDNCVDICSHDISTSDDECSIDPDKSDCDHSYSGIYRTNDDVPSCIDTINTSDNPVLEVISSANVPLHVASVNSFITNVIQDSTVASSSKRGCRYGLSSSKLTLEGWYNKYYFYNKAPLGKDLRRAIELLISYLFPLILDNNSRIRWNLKPSIWPVDLLFESPDTIDVLTSSSKIILDVYNCLVNFFKQKDAGLDYSIISNNHYKIVYGPLANYHPVKTVFPNKSNTVGSKSSVWLSNDVDSDDDASINFVLNNSNYSEMTDIYVFSSPACGLAIEHNCPFILDGQKYGSVFQYCCYKIALLIDLSLAKAILISTNVSEIYSLIAASPLYNKYEFRVHANRFIFEGNIAKFLSNKVLFNALFAIKNESLIAYANYVDNYWGTGVEPKCDIIKYPKFWRGRNIIGRELNRFKDYLSNYVRTVGRTTKVFERVRGVLLDNNGIFHGKGYYPKEYLPGPFSIGNTDSSSFHISSHVSHLVKPDSIPSKPIENVAPVFEVRRSNRWKQGSSGFGNMFSSLLSVLLFFLFVSTSSAQFYRPEGKGVESYFAHAEGSVGLWVQDSDVDTAFWSEYSGRLFVNHEWQQHQRPSLYDFLERRCKDATSSTVWNKRYVIHSDVLAFFADELKQWTYVSRRELKSGSYSLIYKRLGLSVNLDVDDKLYICRAPKDISNVVFTIGYMRFIINSSIIDNATCISLHSSLEVCLPSPIYQIIFRDVMLNASASNSSFLYYISNDYVQVVVRHLPSIGFAAGGIYGYTSGGTISSIASDVLAGWLTGFSVNYAYHISRRIPFIISNPSFWDKLSAFSDAFYDAVADVSSSFSSVVSVAADVKGNCFALIKSTMPHLASSLQRDICTMADSFITAYAASLHVSSVFGRIVDYSYDVENQSAVDSSASVRGEFYLDHFGLDGKITYIREPDGSCYPLLVHAIVSSTTEKCNRKLWKQNMCSRWVCSNLTDVMEHGHLVACRWGGPCNLANCIPQTRHENQLQAIVENQVEAYRIAGHTVDIDIEVQTGQINYCYTVDKQQTCQILPCVNCIGKPYQTMGVSETVRGKVNSLGFVNDIVRVIGISKLILSLGWVTDEAPVSRYLESVNILAELYPKGTPSEVITFSSVFIKYGIVLCTDQPQDFIIVLDSYRVIVHKTSSYDSYCHIGYINKVWQLEFLKAFQSKINIRSVYDDNIISWIESVNEQRAKFISNSVLRTHGDVMVIDGCPISHHRIGKSIYITSDVCDQEVDVDILSYERMVYYWKSHELHNWKLLKILNASISVIIFAGQSLRLEQEIAMILDSGGYTHSSPSRPGFRNHFDYLLFYVTVADSISVISSVADHRVIYLVDSAASDIVNADLNVDFVMRYDSSVSPLTRIMFDSFTASSGFSVDDDEYFTLMKSQSINIKRDYQFDIDPINDFEIINSDVSEVDNLKQQIKLLQDRIDLLLSSSNIISSDVSAINDEVIYSKIDFRIAMQGFQRLFPKQTDRFWSIIGSQSRSVVGKFMPYDPAIILLVIPSKTSITAECFINRYSNFMNSLFSGTKTAGFYINMNNYIDEDPDAVKLHLDNAWEKSFSSGEKFAVIDHIESMNPEVALLFYKYCDNDNAPYKRSSIILTLYVEDHIKRQDSAVERYLENLWGLRLLEKFQPLMSRIANSIVFINPEKLNLLSDSHCKVGRFIYDASFTMRGDAIRSSSYADANLGDVYFPINHHDLMYDMKAISEGLNDNEAKLISDTFLDSNEELAAELFYVWSSHAAGRDYIRSFIKNFMINKVAANLQRLRYQYGEELFSTYQCLFFPSEHMWEFLSSRARVKSWTFIRILKFLGASDIGISNLNFKASAVTSATLELPPADIAMLILLGVLTSCAVLFLMCKTQAYVPQIIEERRLQIQRRNVISRPTINLYRGKKPILPRMRKASCCSQESEKDRSNSRKIELPSMVARIAAVDTIPSYSGIVRPQVAIAPVDPMPTGYLTPHQIRMQAIIEQAKMEKQAALARGEIWEVEDHYPFLIGKI